MPAQRGSIDTHFFRTRAGIVLTGVAAAIALAALAAALQPFPSRHLAMATGPPGSAYARAGERYREILARDGVHLRLVATNGAVENLRLLHDRRSGIDVGFIQSGGGSETGQDAVESLGTVFYEAVWLFCRCPGDPLFPPGSVPRISIGPEGSADRPLALKLLALNGFDPSRVRLLAYPPERAAHELLAGSTLDAVLILSSWDSPVVKQLSRSPGITLRQFARADAYVALDPSLSKLILPRGVADLAHDLPPQDTALIASKASLAVRADLHPALQYLLLCAAMEIHARPTMFQRAGEFPAPEEIDIPLSREARDVYRGGPTFLQRTLPFWLAVLVQRALILILPVVGIVYPLWSLVPRLYRWRTQRRVLHAYRDLLALESALARSPGEPGLLRQLEELYRRVIELRLPMAFGEMAYNLKAHVRIRLEQLRRNS